MAKRTDQEREIIPESETIDARFLEEGDELPDAEDDRILLEGPLELSHDELLAESEYNVRMAGQDPFPVTAGRSQRLGIHQEEDISVDPEELGRRVLEEATQDFHSSTEDDELPEAEWPSPRWGERHLRELEPDEEDPDRLVIRLRERGEWEEELSDRAMAELEARRQRRQRKPRK